MWSEKYGVRDLAVHGDGSAEERGEERGGVGSAEQRGEGEALVLEGVFEERPRDSVHMPRVHHVDRRVERHCTPPSAPHRDK